MSWACSTDGASPAAESSWRSTESDEDEPESPHLGKFKELNDTIALHRLGKAVIKRGPVSPADDAAAELADEAARRVRFQPSKVPSLPIASDVPAQEEGEPRSGGRAASRGKSTGRDETKVRRECTPITMGCTCGLQAEMFECRLQLQGGCMNS